MQDDGIKQREMKFYRLTVSSSVAAGELTQRNPLTLSAELIKSPSNDGKLNADGKYA